MADTIDVSFVPAFQNTIVPLFAEDPDGLRESVRLRTNIIGKQDHWDRLGGVELVAVTNRHQETPHTEMTPTRRRGSPSHFAGAQFLDKLDEVKINRKRTRLN